MNMGASEARVKTASAAISCDSDAEADRDADGDGEGASGGMVVGDSVAAAFDSRASWKAW